MFRIRFLGTPASAERLAKVFLSVRRKSGGERGWRNHVVCGVRVFFNPDRNPFQLKLEAATKKLFRAIQKLDPSTEYYVKYQDGIVSTDFTRVVRVVVSETDATYLEFDKAGLDKTSTNKADVKLAFAEAFSDRNSREVTGSAWET